MKVCWTENKKFMRRLKDYNSHDTVTSFNKLHGIVKNTLPF